MRELQLQCCELLIFPDSPLSPSTGAGPDDWMAAADRLAEAGIHVSALGSYTNHLSSSEEEARSSQRHLAELIKIAPYFHCNTIGTFAGRSPELSIEQNIPLFCQAFTPLCQQAEDAGVRIAIENCPMFIGWPFRGINFAHTPASWDMMFDAVSSPALGLEYDPSHLICQMIDPVAVIAPYADRIFHVHAKDAEIVAENLDRYGIMDRNTARHRMPGLGRADWSAIIAELQANGYTGDMNIEGRHDPEYHGSRETEGLRIAVDHLLDVLDNPV